MKQQNQEKVKRKFKIDKDLIDIIAWGAVTCGTVYLLGASKGVKIGHARGRIQGYAEATRDIADMIRQSVTVKTE